VLNDITRELSKDAQCILYVDDFTIFVSASKSLIQNTIKELEKWTIERGMRFSPKKTIVMKFNKRNKSAEPNLTLYNKKLGR